MDSKPDVQLMTQEAKQALQQHLRTALGALQNHARSTPSRELSLAITNAEQALHWLAHVPTEPVSETEEPGRRL